MQGAPPHRSVNVGLDSVEELKKNIAATHEDFMKEEDPDKKADALRYLSSYATQFLYLVPHDKKFIFKETERVLHQSAMNINDFDPREASMAFEYLARYAQNILDQPWRKDFHIIKLTSGFYVHNISSQLSNAHEILVAMGYVHVDEMTLQVLPKIDERRIKNVSRDMIVASQECLILSSIWQRVADQEPDYPLTTGEVFEFRRKYLGNTDTICQTMLLDIRRRNHDDKMQRYSKHSTGKNFVPVDKLIDYEEMEVEDSRDGGDNVEAVVVSKVLENTLLMHDSKRGPRYDDEHIYDPVYSGGGGGMVNGTSSRLPQNINNFPLFPHRGSSAFVPLIPDSSQYHPHEVRPHPSRESVNSPLIPQTVANFVPSSSVRGRRSEPANSYCLPGGSSGGSSGSGSGTSIIGERLASSGNRNNGSTHTQALQFSKISQEDMGNWGDRRMKSENHSGSNRTTTLNWSDFSSNHQGSLPSPTNLNQNHHRHRYSERIQPSDQQQHDNVTRSRKPIMPNDVYPDDYFPRLVKPTPVNSSQRYTINKPLPPSPPPEDSGEEDLMHAALDYRSKVISNGPPSTSSKFATTTGEISSATSRMVKSEVWGETTDTRSVSSSLGGLSLSRYSDNDGESKRSPATSPEMEGAWNNGSVDHPHMSQAARKNNSNVHVSSSSSSSGGRHRQIPVESREPINTASSPRSPTTAGTAISNSPEIEAVYYQQLLQRGKSSSSVATETDPNLNYMPPSSSSRKSALQEKQITARIIPWSCRTCTYKNKKSERICEMCAKSNDYFEEEEEEQALVEQPTPSAPRPSSSPHLPTTTTPVPLEKSSVPKLYSQPNIPIVDPTTPTSPTDSNLIPCPQCTLLNQRTRFECEVCGMRLRNASFTNI